MSDYDLLVKTDQETLLKILLAAYAFTVYDRTRLASILAPAYLAAMQRGAQKAQGIVGAAQNWQPDAKITREAEAQAAKAAAGIAETFSTLLEGFVKRSGFSTLSEATTGIVDWLHGMLRWKVPQVVNTTCGLGNDAGLGTIVQEILDGELVDEDTQVIGADGYQIEVVPDESSSDICAEYAGNTYDLSDWDSIPPFPIHPNCIHSKVLSAIS